MTEQRSLVRPDSYRDQYVPLNCMATVYVLYSPSIDKFYIGSCTELAERFSQHLSDYFPGAFTGQTKDWSLYFKIDHLDYSQARNIEDYIKRMKSRKYINNLKRYPELVEKLIKKYK